MLAKQVVYKLTDMSDQTYGGCQWGENVTHRALGRGDLCTSGWIHVYSDPVLAMMMDPAGGDYQARDGGFHLWKCRGNILKDDHGLKGGCKEVTTLRRIKPPHITLPMRVRFAILCAQYVYSAPSWKVWAKKWLSGRDRSANAASYAAHATYTAYAATNAASYAAAHAAYAAINAAYAAANAAHAAADPPGIDFVAIARQAVEEERALAKQEE